MHSDRIFRAESPFLRANRNVPEVIDHLLTSHHRYHGASLTEYPEVRPEGSTQKANAVQDQIIVIQEMDIGAVGLRSCFLHNPFVMLTVKLMVAQEVNDRFVNRLAQGMARTPTSISPARITASASVFGGSRTENSL